MRHILLTTDFSKNAQHAINYALNLFTYSECKFYILHVVKSSSFISDDLIQMKPKESIYTELIANSKQKLETLIHTLKNTHNNLLHTFEPIVDYDNLVASVNQTVALYNIELIVMGTKGVSNFSEAIFGSNTLRVFQRCQVSVLAIPDNCPIKPIKNVLFTTKYQSVYKPSDLSILINLAEHYNFKLDVLHISETEAINNKQQQIQQDLNTYFKNLNHEFVHETENDYLETVLKYIKNNDIELFSMMRKQHTFFEHLFINYKTKQIAYHIEVPFLILAYKNK